MTPNDAPLPGTAAVATSPARPSVWTRRYGTPVWDAVLRGTGAAGLLGIALVLLVPSSAGPVIFALLAIWLNGPASVVVPAGFEPMLLLFGRLYPPLLVAVIGTLAAGYIEFFNYYLFRGVLGLRALRRVREHGVTRWAVGLFARRPFFVVWLLAWAPVPFTVARALSAVAGYPVGRHVLAVTLGRFPRFWLFALLGDALRIRTALVWGFFACMLAVGVVAAVWRLVLRRREHGAPPTIA